MNSNLHISSTRQSYTNRSCLKCLMSKLSDLALCLNVTNPLARSLACIYKNELIRCFCTYVEVQAKPAQTRSQLPSKQIIQLYHPCLRPVIAYHTGKESSLAGYAMLHGKTYNVSRKPPSKGLLWLCWPTDATSLEHSPFTVSRPQTTADRVVVPCARMRKKPKNSQPAANKQASRGKKCRRRCGCKANPVSQLLIVSARRRTIFVHPSLKVKTTFFPFPHITIITTAAPISSK